MKKIKVGIIGAAGYTGGELIRVLRLHEFVSITFVHSNSQKGKAVADIHTDLIGDTNLQFTEEINFDIDVLFLCVAHHQSKLFLQSHAIPRYVRIIDLSQDFRDESEGFVYGLPEKNKAAIIKSTKVANPGCFATAIQLALLPLFSNKLLQAPIHINGTTGATGAGQAFSETTHFSWRQNNLSVYKAFEHQHLKEVKLQFSHLQPDFKEAINFIPQRGSFTRGILTNSYTTTALTKEEAISIYSNYYLHHPFVHISQQPIDLKQVVNTNKCILHIEVHETQIMITSCIDNLLKGASGQAVQNMNLMFGLEETTGLKLKANYF